MLPKTLFVTVTVGSGTELVSSQTVQLTPSHDPSLALQAQLNDSSLFRAVFDRALEPSFLISSRALVHVNRSAVELLDSGSAESLVGQDVQTLFDKGERDRMANLLSRSENSLDEPFVEPMWLVGKYGRRFKSPIRFQTFTEHSKLFTLIQIEDDSALGSADQPWTEGDETSDLVASELPIPYFQIDEFGRCIACNADFCDVLGADVKQIADRSILEWVIPDDEMKSVQLMAKTLRSGRHDTELRVRASDGSEREFLIKAFRKDADNCRGIGAVALDISWKKDAEARLRYERDYANAVLNCLPGVFYHYDGDLALRRWNDNHELITGYSPVELAGSSPLSFIAPDMRGQVLTKIDEVLSTGSAHVEADYLLKDGRCVPFLFTAVRFEHEGKMGFVGTGTNISEQKDLEASLRKQQALFEAQVESSHSGILVTDDSGRRLIQNQRFNEMWGIAPEIAESAESDDLLRLVASKTPNSDEFVARVEWLNANPDLFSNEEIELNDGRIIERYSGPVLGSDGTYYGRNWLHRDITKRKRFERKIRYLATHDSLTNVANRAAVRDRMEQAMASYQLTGKKFAVLFIDLDRFKIVNDGYGHPFGDAVLKETATRLQKLAKKKDLVARYGGDEFLFLLSNLTVEEDACTFAERVVSTIERPIRLQDREIFISASVGISLFPHDGVSSDVLIDCANLAMYRAKELGRSNCQVFSTQMSNEVQRSVTVETELRRAIEEEKLHLVFQPKVSLASGQITGCEALVRWNDPVLGAVSPSEFIPIAEESGLIVRLGDWVLRQSCEHAMDWKKRGLPEVCVAVNVSNRQFLQYDLFEWAMESLQRSGLPPELLEIELTERIISHDVKKALNDVNLLREVGVKFSIDDFGTGYSSLSYLSQFKMDTLKVDQAFVRNMLERDHDANIVRTIITMAHNLGFKAIAEGVETEEQCKMLVDLKCDEIQGYYFSPPVLPDDFVAMLGRAKMLPEKFRIH